MIKQLLGHTMVDTRGKVEEFKEAIFRGSCLALDSFFTEQELLQQWEAFFGLAAFGFEEFFGICEFVFSALHGEVEGRGRESLN